MAKRVRLAKANAVWITGELANEADFSGCSEIVIDEHWPFGDASVLAPGYDVRLLPVSGIAQLFIYELLVNAATEPRSSAVPPVSDDQLRGRHSVAQLA